MMLTVVKPEQHRDRRLASNLERGVGALDEDDEVGPGVDLAEIDRLGLESDLGPASSQAFLQVLARVDLGLSKAEDNLAPCVTPWPGVVGGPRVVWGVEQPSTSHRGRQVGVGGRQVDQVDIVGWRHLG
jgi:hypothetical protein